MPTTQMNVRIDEGLKRRGDAALAEAGYTPSQVVRLVWEQAATSGESAAELFGVLGSPPSTQGPFELRRQAILEEDEAARRAVDELLARSALPAPSTEGLDLDELRWEAHEQRMRERGLA